ncbi:MAG TPA: hypothetical protein DCE33_05630, partial [Rhodospirillaceae bacterium]|nr:hypothetical protein [Rhodospirillaceae bacterium]
FKTIHKKVPFIVPISSALRRHAQELEARELAAQVTCLGHPHISGLHFFQGGAASGHVGVNARECAFFL